MNSLLKSYLTLLSFGRLIRQPVRNRFRLLYFLNFTSSDVPLRSWLDVPSNACTSPKMASPRGFEPPTCCLEGSSSNPNELQGCCWRSRPDSNWQPSPWQGDALNLLCYNSKRKARCMFFNKQIGTPFAFLKYYTNCTPNESWTHLPSLKSLCPNR